MSCGVGPKIKTFFLKQDHGTNSGGKTEGRLSSPDLYCNNLYDTYVFKVKKNGDTQIQETRAKPTANGTVQSGHKWQIWVGKVSTTC